MGERYNVVVYVCNGGTKEREFKRHWQAVKFCQHLEKKGRGNDILSTYKKSDNYD